MALMANDMHPTISTTASSLTPIQTCVKGTLAHGPKWLAFDGPAWTPPLARCAVPKLCCFSVLAEGGRVLHERFYGPIASHIQKFPVSTKQLSAIMEPVAAHALADAAAQVLVDDKDLINTMREPCNNVRPVLQYIHIVLSRKQLAPSS